MSVEADALERLSRSRYLPGDRALLPLTLPTDVVAGALGLSTWAVYDQTREGTFPLAPLRLGRKLRWRTRDVLELLGVLDLPPASAGTSPPLPVAP